MFFCFSRYGDHRDLHVLTHSFPTRRSSDLTRADWCGLIVTSKLRSRAVAVCGTMSWLTQTIVSPTLRLAGAGPKRIRVISITCSADGGAAAVVMRQQSTAEIGRAHV